jgi:serine/threonine protein kinase
MPLSTGDKLGPYEILAPLGAGGMGEVYRALDTRLRRDVAIKVSADRFSERFETEARAIASLNHPNVCTLYDVGPNYLVMELVEGRTLAERIAQGAIPPDETLAIAKQIADALEAAHETGITHRDLKPGNIKIKPDGMVKVLDFGLAKMGGTPTTHSDTSPTLTVGPTQAGVILGTAAYMAPEQARGKDVDRRADIWAFGVVLYEMLTGKRLFQGEDLTETLASVVKEEPNLDQAPPQVRRLLEKCLEKDPKRRLRDIGDAWALLVGPSASTVPARSRLWPAIAAVCLLIAIAGWLAFLYLRPKPHPPPIQRFAIAAPDRNVSLSALSPDGTAVVFSVVNGTGSQLWLRRLDSLEARPLKARRAREGFRSGRPIADSSSSARRASSRKSMSRAARRRSCVMQER